MKRISARTAAVLLLTFSLSLIALVAQARAPGNTLTPEFRRLMKEYGLEVVAKCPPGVAPIVLSSTEELTRVLSSTVGTSLGMPLQLVGTREQVLSGGTLLRRYHWRGGGPVYYWNLAANVYIGSYGSFTWIDSISGVRFYLSGVTLGVDLTDVWTDWLIDPRNGQCAMISGGGIIEWYFLIPDVIVYRSVPVELIEYVNVNAPI